MLDIKNNKRTNLIVGWSLFAIAFIVYLLTVERTASLWDCAEFISVSYKLEVPHPPGAPLFLLIGRIFSFFAFGNVENIAFAVNMLPVLSSALTVALLYWSIVMIARKLLKRMRGEDGLSSIDNLALILAGVIGALSFAFTDSFWFSATEAEVYGLSSFFTAIVFWAILKWEYIEDDKSANRWLLLIAYLMGLSIGVHLLNLLTMPCLGLIIYFKKYKPNWKGVVLVFIISMFAIGLILAGIITGLPSLAGIFEIYFINNLGLPYGTGITVLIILLFASLTLGIIYSYRKKNGALATIFLSLLLIVIGYSSYVTIVIRAAYNPPINENDPSGIQSYISYLKREQYGEWPLLYGPDFTAKLVDQEQGDPVYVKKQKILEEENKIREIFGEEKIEITDTKSEYVVSQYKINNIYEDKSKKFFPRMHSDRHAKDYRRLLGLKKGETPAYFDHLQYMIFHQFGHFYMRYFLWNFSGRQSDIQDAGYLLPIDTLKDAPYYLKVNKARNQYYMLPLILGFLGLLFQLGIDKRNTLVLGTFFLMTGIFITFYLNPPPVEPRERDYIYAGSYYAFAFWIGLGVLFIYTELLTKLKSKTALSLALGISTLVPLILITENWDDHDRSNRSIHIDVAKASLENTSPNPIIFTGGDNDTFPFWYLQEVEEVRQDARVIVLTYFNTDWYLQQMQRQAYQSPPLPFSLRPLQYKQGGLNDYLPVLDPDSDKMMSLKAFLKYVKEDNENLQRPASFSNLNIVPVKSMYLNVDKEDIIAKGIVPSELEQYIVDKMQIDLTKNHLYKSDLMILDLIATNNWERPIYFNTTSLAGTNLDLRPYVVQEGALFRLLPVRAFEGYPYDLANKSKMEHFLFENPLLPGIENKKDNYYNSEDFIARTVTPIRSYYNDLATSYLNQNLDVDTVEMELIVPDFNKQRAKNIIEYSLKHYPGSVIPHDFITLSSSLSILLQVGEVDRAVELGVPWANHLLEEIEHRMLNNTITFGHVRIYLQFIDSFCTELKESGNEEEGEKLYESLNSTAKVINDIMEGVY